MYLCYHLGADSKNFDKNVLLPLLDKLDSDTLNKIHFSIVLVPLPYHISSQKVTQSLLYTLGKKGDNVALEALRYYFDNIPQFNEDKIKGMTINAFEEYVS